MPIIFLNPGHDAKRKDDNNPIDCGAVNHCRCLFECDLAKEISAIVERELKRNEFTVYNIQDDNLQWVCQYANNLKADVFVSIHLNAANTKAKGLECWYFKGTNSGGDKLSKEIYNAIAKDIPNLDNCRGVRCNDWYYVLKHTTMTSTLVEVGFIDNDDECDVIADNIEKIGIAISKGIMNYFYPEASV